MSTTSVEPQRDLGPDDEQPRGSARAALAAGVPRDRRGWVDLVFRLQSLFGLLLVFAAAVVFSPRRNGEVLFLDPTNIANVVRATSVIGIIAVGMTFVILVGGIDLSVGAVLGLAATGTAALLVNSDQGVLVTCLVVLAIGLVVGVAQGLISTKLGIQSFIVTLAGLQIARGLARMWSGGQGIPLAYGDGPDLAPDSFSVLNSRVLGGTVPVPALIFVVVAAVAIWVLRRTTFARHVYAIGGNERAARLSGVPVVRVKVAVFAISGVLAALAGIVHAGQLNQGSPNAGIGYELNAIAAVVIGGTSLMGGSGTVVGTVAGALLLGILNNVLALNNIDANIQLLTTGVVIIIAVALQSVRRRV
ncbi:ABC transporter permease [Vallicoccus soli]|uniref:ABC transporter permease n=1 Tax=Vallicoccus soli TaxID=2339232 RepID=A0A3A3Z1J4_9ACTN|nr:ABC transporter permease [Vallicoccus soli]RJK96387.1 ABC transporter permease [Vallicoccus soli]